MAGYDNFSMSNNARQAYADGRYPASQMVKHLKKHYPRTFRGLTISILKEIVGSCEYHHTSCRYNCTDFYDIVDVYEARGKIKELLRKIQRAKKAIQHARDKGFDYVPMPDNPREKWFSLDGVIGKYGVNEDAVKVLENL